MQERNLMAAIFGVIELVTKSELTNIARTLIINYYQGSEQPTCALRAREAVLRYSQCRVLPRLADIKSKERHRLDQLEHAVLRMEYEAALIDGSWPPAVENPPAVAADRPASAAPEAANFAMALPVPPGGRKTPRDRTGSQPSGTGGTAAPRKKAPPRTAAGKSAKRPARRKAAGKKKPRGK